MKKAIITLYYKVTWPSMPLPPCGGFLYHKEMHRGCQGFSYLVSDQVSSVAVQGARPCSPVGPEGSPRDKPTASNEP